MPLDSIPQELRLYKQWICWRLEDTDSLKPTKIPYSAKTGKLASVTNCDTWVSFDQAKHVFETTKWYDGIGFVLTAEDPFAFIDLDDAKDQTTLDRQMQVFNEFNSYAEKSPSGKGLHIIVKGRIPVGRRRSNIEIYSSSRYMTMTGDVYRDEPIKEYNELLNSLFDKMSNGNQISAFYAGLSEAKETDETILEYATKAANGEKFLDLWEGRWQNYYVSQSEADFALINIIAFYSENRQQVKRMFLNSALGKRDKAKRNDYTSWMLNRCFDKMLPPVDIDGLQNQLAEALAKVNVEKHVEINNVAPSLSNEIQQVELNYKDLPKITSNESDIYSVPPGLVGEVAQFIYAQAPRPVPEIALAGALGMMSGIVGRSYNVSGTGLNQYMLLLAPTGYGKEAMARGIDKLFNCVTKTVPSARDFVGPAEIASPQAAIKYMSRGSTSFTSLVGEFGIQLQQMGSVNAPPHLMGLRRFLLMVYNKSGEGDTFHPSIYSDKEKNTNSIISPALSILGESTPEKFYEGLHEGLIVEGLLPRFTTIEYKGNLVPLSETFLQAYPSFELIDKLATICSYSLTLNSQHKSIPVQFGHEFTEFRLHCDAQVNATDRELVRNLWTRAHMKALKLASVVAVGCNFYDPVITPGIGKWAIDIVKADVNNLLDKFRSGEIGVDNDETKQIANAMKVIKKYILAPWNEVATTAGSKLSNLHQNKIVPYAYIHRNLACVAAFKKDRLGSTNAIRRVLQTLLERGDIEEISKAELKKNYGTGCRAFMVANLKAFGIG